jgi:hypothetical protein
MRNKPSVGLSRFLDVRTDQEGYISAGLWASESEFWTTTDNVLTSLTLKSDCSSSIATDRSALATNHGSVLTMDGFTLGKDGSTFVKDGSVLATDGSVLATDGSVLATDGSVLATDGSVLATDGSVFTTAGPALAKHGSVFTAGCSVFTNDGSECLYKNRPASFLDAKTRTSASGIFFATASHSSLIRHVKEDYCQSLGKFQQQNLEKKRKDTDSW